MLNCIWLTSCRQSGWYTQRAPDPLTSIVSAGERLSLPLDSCCSVSLVSCSHADLVGSQRQGWSHLKNQCCWCKGSHSPNFHTVEQWQRNITDASSFWSFLANSFPRESIALCKDLGGSYANSSIHFQHPSMSIACSLKNPRPQASHRSSNTLMNSVLNYQEL